VASRDNEHLAQTAYEAHRNASGGSLPSWEDADDEQKRAWRIAVSAITDQGDVTVASGVRAQSLVIEAGDHTRVFQTEFTVGRQGTLAISDEHASSHHALFQPAHGLWYVEDLGSTNGTFLNGRRIFSSQRLKKGDKVRVGHTVIIIVGAG
jgi:pSer/pThr/pTyr-binding forkhead associated (FHA) protein